MPSRYFPKPQPLSQKTKTWVEKGVRYQKDSRVRGGKRRVKGTWTSDSIYYLWFEYLKRSEKYKTACANNGKGMKKLYKDFGNVFGYEGVEGFWIWWKERGQLLFSAKPLSNIYAFFNIDDIEDYKTEIDKGQILLLPIPTSGSREVIKKSVNKLIDEIDIQKDKEHKPKYEVAQTKVDVESFKSCLMAYDLKQQGLDILDIGLRVKWISGAEAKDLIEDGRSRGKEYDIAELESESYKSAKKYVKVHDKVIEKLTAQNKKEEALFDRAIVNDNKGLIRGGLASLGRQGIDYLSDKKVREEMLKEGYAKTFEERTKRKKSIRTHTHRLIAKAKANIEAVERGMFGVGH